MEKIVIIGTGPAGLTAAIYAARADLEPLVISGRQPGGQLMLTSEVENYPGFPDGILGPDLMMNMRKQAERFGARFVDDEASEVNFTERPLQVCVGSVKYEAEAVIIATGASARWLGVPGETRLTGKGTSSCATCDGFFFRNKKVAVIGGGDTALEDAIFLTKFASKVTIVHRRDALRGSKILQDRAKNNVKIEFLWNSVVEEILGENRVSGIKVKNVLTSEVSDLPLDGVFVAIGHTPNTKVFAGQIDLNQQGYIKLYEGSKTNVSGVFVAGDVEDYHYRQAVTAAGAGCRAALDAEAFIEDKD